MILGGFLIDDYFHSGCKYMHFFRIFQNFCNKKYCFRGVFFSNDTFLCVFLRFLPIISCFFHQKDLPLQR